MTKSKPKEFPSIIFHKSELLGVVFTLGVDPSPSEESLKLYYIETKDYSVNSKFPDDYIEVNYETVHEDNISEILRCKDKLKSEWWKQYQYIDDNPEFFN
jgi:hypothetical protein